MSRPVTPASGMRSGLGSRPPSLYGDDIPGVANVDGSFHEGTYATGALQDGGSVKEGSRPGLPRSNSQLSHTPSRGGTLKKKASLSKATSLKRSGSRKSSYAGSVRSLRVGERDKYEPEEYNSAFYCPVPTAGSPTELLAERFQAWRRVLKDLINYFRDLHKSYDNRSKTLLSASNVINNTTTPVHFLRDRGIGEATEILQQFHKLSLTEAQKARELENEVILQLTGLRSDLSQKIKEIKSLSGDFKNSVGKEQEQTKKAVNAFQEALGSVDHDIAAASGSRDPFVMKLQVERQLDRQIEEENYLHRAYLNLEASGRELESIVVGEIQKAYNVLAGVLKRDADGQYDTVEKLREGPLAMARDHEWDAFVVDNENMVDPNQAVRQVEQITYPGKNHPAAIEVKSGMLERKSKYLKNYTPGWYVLSPTHLHEFKSADQIAYQQPVMSLYLPEQKLGSHSDPGSSSHKFMLKGRQTGSMHRGHTWIFRAESYDTMMTWYSDIKELTEKRGEARNEFVRRNHARSISQGSMGVPSVSSGDSQMGEDEADKIAFSTEESIRGFPTDSEAETGLTGPAGVGATITKNSGTTDDGRSEAGWRPPQQRPKPGGRFPSDLNVTRGLQAPLSPSSGGSTNDQEHDALAQAGALPTGLPFTPAGGDTIIPLLHETKADTKAVGQSETQPTGYTAGEHALVNAQPSGAEVANDTQSTYREWVGTMGGAVGGATLGASAVAAQQKSRQTATNTANQLEDVTAHPVENEIVHPEPTVPIVAAATTNSYQTTEQADSGKHDVVHSEPIVVNGGLIGGTDVRAPVSNTATATQTETQTETETEADTEAETPVPKPDPMLQYTSTEPNPAAVDESSIVPPPRPNYHHAHSVSTISDLHVPGEFPRKS